MTGFEQELQRIGYILYRTANKFDNKKGLIRCSNKELQLSTMGYLSFYWADGNNEQLINRLDKSESIDFETKSMLIEIGLEFSIIPTIIYPRPKIRAKRLLSEYNPMYMLRKELSDRIIITDETLEGNIHHCMSNEKVEDIIHSMYNNDLVFEYDFTKKQ